MKSFNKKEFLFLFTITLCLCASSVMLYHELFLSGKNRTGEQVGTITYKNKFAEQKPGGTTLWTALSQNAPVFNKDTIRTGEGSTAIIYLNNKTEMTLNEESMVFIDVQKNEPSITLTSGNIALDGINNQQTIHLNTPSGQISVKGGSLKIQDSEAGFNIQLLDGTTELTSGSSGETITLGKNGNYDIETNTSTLPDFSLSHPQDGAVFVSVSADAEISFSWEDNRSDLTTDPQGQALLIAGDSAFKKIVHTLAGAQTGIRLPLAGGFYYWKIAGSPEIRTFTILQGKRPKPLSPVDKIFIHVESPLTIPFFWTRVEEADLYRVEVYMKGASPTPLYSRISGQNNLSFDFLATGEYFWKVFALFGPDQIEFPSTENSFSIIDGSLAPPEINETTLQETPTVSAHSIGEGKIIASWKPVANAKRYNVAVSTDPAGKSIVLLSETSLNSFHLKTVLPEGNYYVAAQSLSGEIRSSFSAPLKIEVVPLSNIFPLEPAEGETIPASKNPVRFSWDDANGGSRYRLQVSTSRDFQTLVVDAATKKSATTTVLPEGSVGLMYWKAVLLDSNGLTVAETKISTLIIDQAIPPPVPISPIRGEQLDVNTLDKLVFKWVDREEPYTYTIRFFRMSGGIKTLINQWETEDSSLLLSDISNLSLDTFAWEITAVSKTEEDVRQESDPVISYFKIIQKKPLSVPTIKLMTSKGEY